MKFHITKSLFSLACGAAVLLGSTAVVAEEAPLLVPIKRMSMETALRVAQGAIKACRKEGVQIAVTVVDRGGHPQVMLRDVLAMDMAQRISEQKAYAAMSFNAPTSSLEGRFKTYGSVGKIEGAIFSAGGIPVQAGGQIIGGVGVSGAPSGKTDESCAQAGIAAVQDDLDMAGD